MTHLFDPLKIGNITLANRLIMAPMTRGRATPEAIPTPMMIDYYRQRADAGLIITEATAISPQGYGWVNAPGIWSESQIKAWQPIPEAVHKAGGHIFMQLWHMGRVSHPDFLGGKLPVGPSALAAQGEAHTQAGKKPYVTPQALTVEEIQAIINDYAKAAKNAVAAGFDGVEIHGANGYLIDQFIRDGSNKRTDNYGGSLDNRLKFLIDVTTAVCQAIGASRVGVRLSPVGPYNDMQDSNPKATFSRAAELLSPMKLAFLHIMEALPGHFMANAGERVSPAIRAAYQGILITNGGYTKELANAALANNEADAIAFGVPFIANPDLVKRVQTGAPLNAPDMNTFYSAGEKGYSDYPRLK